MKLFNSKKSSGVHPPENKLSGNKKVEYAGLPREVTLPLCQHIGAPATAIVKRGEEVKTGQKIADASGFVSVPIHSTVSGKVKKITQTVNAVTSRAMEAVVIESDGRDEWVELHKPAHPGRLSKEEIIEIIKEAGIVGLGGATFPTHVKLQPPADKPIDSIIVNGCECEPYITSDHRLMLEHGEEILQGLEIMMKVINCSRAYIAIEDNKPDAVGNMNKLLSRNRYPGKITVESLGTQYPLGAEKTLLKRILGREVPVGCLPMEVGVVVQNVGTLKAIHDAVYLGKPLIERVVTVTGMVREPKNLLSRFGRPAQELIDMCGGMAGDGDVMIFGGPMMGVTQSSFQEPVQKGTNSILVKKSDKVPESNCIRCGACVESCPMDLMPMVYVQYTKNEWYEELEDYWIENCVECGSCAYSCPAHIPIVQYIKVGKSQLAKRRCK
ncbi:MAG: electron transport complex subunit RsxC [Thermoplasmata archaeon]